MSHTWAFDTNETMTIRLITRKTTAVLLLMAVAVTACGDDPLGAVGRKSSAWINEPKVVTTTVPPVVVPVSVGVDDLYWSNDGIANDALGDLETPVEPGTVIAVVFARREGDRFIQASREEIATALPGVRFPAVVPYGAQWVSSQLVIENSGLLASDPSAAFGIWSAEPYTRSRSVAQMAVLNVSSDRETALEVAESDAEASCARFADQTTELCDIVDIANRPVWRLSGQPGTTHVWFDGAYRYELFARSFVNNRALEAMIGGSVGLSEISPPSS